MVGLPDSGSLGIKASFLASKALTPASSSGHTPVAVSPQVYFRRRFQKLRASYLGCYDNRVVTEPHVKLSCIPEPDID